MYAWLAAISAGSFVLPWSEPSPIHAAMDAILMGSAVLNSLWYLKLPSAPPPVIGKSGEGQW